MSHVLSAITVLCVAMVACAGTDPTFSPGCSFYGGQCVYSIKLGHSGQCDKPQTETSPAAGCCDDLSTKYSRLKDDMDKLRTQVNVMTKMIGDSSKNMSGLEAELQKALRDRDDIVKRLNRKESELSSTKADLAKVMGDGAKEIQQLREKLNNVQDLYSKCQEALGGSLDTGTVTPGTDSGTQTGDYSLVYYDFNGRIPDFSFPQTRYGHIVMEQLHKGSGVSTGPRVEHSWGISKGSYLGIQGHIIANKIGSSNSDTVVKAESGTFPPASGYCIMFWYYMEGIDVKTLTTNLRIKNGVGYPVFTKTGNVGSHKWELATVDLDNEYTQFEFQIEFTMSTKAHQEWVPSHYVTRYKESDIAIDDLYVYNTSCSNIPRHPKGQQQQQQSFYDQNVTSFYTFHLTPMTWTDAYETCRRQGPWTALVSVETEAEHKALVKMIRANPAYSIVGAKGFYTSGSDYDNEHHFVWTDTGVQREIKLDNWHTGQPNNVAGNQDCLLMEYSNDDYKWGDVDCDTKHPFICEVEVPGKVPN